MIMKYINNFKEITARYLSLIAKKRTAQKLLTVIIMLTLVFVISGCAKKQVITQEEKKVPVETIVVTQKDMSQDLSVTGEILPETEVQVASKVSGRVTSVSVKTGSSVSKGQVLFTLEDNDYRNSWRNAAAALKVAQVNKDQAKDHNERMKKLFSEAVISESEMEQSDHALASATAQLEQAQVVNDTAQENMSNVIITAPVAGQVANLNISEGEIASPQTSQITIVNMQSSKVKVNLSENMVNRVKVGQRIKMSVDAVGSMIEGTVSNIAPQIDPTSKTFPAEISISNPGGKLRGGMVVKLDLPLEKITNALIVPTDTIIEITGTKRVFVVEDGIAKEHTVTTGISNENYTQILSGLKLGEEVIEKGNRLVGDGQKVKVLKQQPNGGAGK